MSILLSCAAFFADRASKSLVERRLDEGEAIELLPRASLRIKHVKNYGLPGGFMSKYPFTCAALSTAMLIILLPASSYVKKSESKLAYGAFMAVLGGGASNVYDRLRNGCVTDFIQFKNGLIYNVADFFIIIGGILFAAASLFKK